jgi:biotin carboxyl carrier protein
VAYQISLEGGEPHEIDVARHGDRATITIDGRDFLASLRGEPDAQVLTLETRSEPVWIATYQDTIWVHAFGRAWQLSLVDPLERVLGGGASEDTAAAPMPGTVVVVAVEAGEAVREGQQLVVIESMKMQSEIVALRDGVVGQVFVEVGDTFDRGAPLVALVPEEEA